MDDFRRKPVNKINKPSLEPVRPVSPPVTPLSTPVKPVSPQVNLPKQEEPSLATQPDNAPVGIDSKAQEINAKPAKKFIKKKAYIILGSIIAAGLLAIAGAFIWYNQQLSPINPNNDSLKNVTIEAGATPSDIADILEEESLIRNSDAFLIYTRLHNLQGKLQAGSYRLSSASSTPSIVDHLIKGKVDTFSITFLPGETLSDSRKTLINSGYSEAEVDAALSKTYNSPLFEGKPANASLEGYIYGETYSFGTNTEVEAILDHVFKQYYSVIEKNNLVELYKARGLTLYQGITLASIVQREASPAATDMAQIAKVFYNRLAIDMPLGSDVTYQYIADKTGVNRDPNLDSPYNTRRYPGLPPGPIASPGEKALIAVANPAEGDYLYFLSGDDDITYFGKTLSEHESNITNHCQKKCQIL